MRWFYYLGGLAVVLVTFGYLGVRLVLGLPLWPIKSLPTQLGIQRTTSQSSNIGPKISEAPSCGSAASNQLVLQSVKGRTPLLLGTATVSREMELINSGPAHIANENYIALALKNAALGSVAKADAAAAYKTCMRQAQYEYERVPNEEIFYTAEVDCNQKAIDTLTPTRDRMKAAIDSLNAVDAVGDVGKAADTEATQIKASLANAEAFAIYSLNTIRWTGKDHDTGALTCAANLKVQVSGYGDAEEPITFTMQKTTEGKDYADVQGLR